MLDAPSLDRAGRHRSKLLWLSGCDRIASHLRIAWICSVANLSHGTDIVQVYPRLYGVAGAWLPKIKLGAKVCFAPANIKVVGQLILGTIHFLSDVLWIREHTQPDRLTDLGGRISTKEQVDYLIPTPPPRLPHRSDCRPSRAWRAPSCWWCQTWWESAPGVLPWMRWATAVGVYSSARWVMLFIAMIVSKPS